MQLQVKTVLNVIQHFPGFVYPRHPACTAIAMASPVASKSPSKPHPGIPAKCSRCLKPAPGYDRLPQRSVALCAVVGNRDVVSLCRPAG